MSCFYNVIDTLKKIMRKNSGHSKVDTVNVMDDNYGIDRANVFVDKAMIKNAMKLVTLSGKNSYRAILKETSATSTQFFEQDAQNVPVVTEGNEGTAMKIEKYSKSNSNISNMEQRFCCFFVVYWFYKSIILTMASDL